MDEFPDGDLAPKAKKRLEELGRAEEEAWEEVKDSNNPDRVESFLKAFPNSGQAEAAKDALNKLRARQEEQEQWHAIENSKTISDFEKFLAAFPKSEHAEEAKARINELKREEAKGQTKASKGQGETTYERERHHLLAREAWESDDPGKLKAFINEWPQSVHVPEARKRLSKLPAPGGDHAPDAKKREEANARTDAKEKTDAPDGKDETTFERERRHHLAWEAVRDTGDVQKLKAFIDQWPQSPHAREARKRVTGNAVRKAWLWFGASVLGTSMLGVFNNAISGEAIFGLLVGAAISFVVGMVRLRERWGQGSEVGVYWLGLSVFGAIVLGFALIL